MYSSSRRSTFITSPKPSVNLSIDANFVTSIKSIKQNSNNIDNFDVRSASKLLKEKGEVDSYGSHKSWREAILYDNEDQMPVTVWENVLDEFEEETLYLFQFISLKNYYGSTLTTTKFIIASDEKGIPDIFPWEAINNYIELDKKLFSQLHPKLCCLYHLKNMSRHWVYRLKFQNGFWEKMSLKQAMTI